MVKQIQKKCSRRFMLPDPRDQECIGMECEQFQRVTGNNPQTGEPIEEYVCAEVLSNILLIENAQKQNQVGAAVESFRNEMVKINDLILRVQQENKEAIESMRSEIAKSNEIHYRLMAAVASDGSDYSHPSASFKIKQDKEE